ncbi:MAG: hypothetical protein U0172_15020 [Nitrospiraceae bacterium]
MEPSRVSLSATVAGLGWAAVLLTASSAWAFKIVTPTDGAPLRSGVSTPVAVDLGKEDGVVKVRYYWYREDAEALVEQTDREAFLAPSQLEGANEQPIVATPALVALSNSTPAFGGALPVPADAAGRMRLLAIAEISRGRLGTRSVFDEVLVTVEPAAALTSIDFEVEKPLKLGRIGQNASYADADSKGSLVSLPVVGLYADGITRAIPNASSGTTFTSSDEAVVKVEAFGLFRLVGTGRAIITATNHGKSATLEVFTELDEEENGFPVAHAGEARTVKGGRRVELNGLGSRDPEGEALSYSWSQVRGSHVDLLDPVLPRASFLAPVVSEPRTFRFKLRVTDKKGADSLPAFVEVTVEP